MVKTSRTYGVELELLSPVMRPTLARRMTTAGVPAEDQGYNHRVCSMWKVTTDSSVRPSGPGDPPHPAEVVSPILSDPSELRRAVGVLSDIGCRVNDTCGLHVHVDVHDLGPAAVRRLLKLWVVHEDAIFALAGIRRHRSTFATPVQRQLALNNACYTMRDCFRSIDRYRGAADAGHLLGRCALSFVAYERQGTVEFRLMGGSLDPDRVANWAVLCTSLVELAKVPRLRVTPTARGLDHLSAMFRSHLPNLGRFMLMADRMTVSELNTMYTRRRDSGARYGHERWLREQLARIPPGLPLSDDIQVAEPTTDDPVRASAAYFGF